MVAAAKAPRDGKVVDVIATYDPVNKRLIDVKEEKLQAWCEYKLDFFV